MEILMWHFMFSFFHILESHPCCTSWQKFIPFSCRIILQYIYLVTFDSPIYLSVNIQRMHSPPQWWVAVHWNPVACAGFQVTLVHSWVWPGCVKVILDWVFWANVFYSTRTILSSQWECLRFLISQLPLPTCVLCLRSLTCQLVTSDSEQ